MLKEVIDVRPEKEYDFKVQKDGNKIVDLYRNIVEKEVVENGQTVKKYEVEHIKVFLPAFDTKTEDNFKTQEQRDFYFNKFEKMKKDKEKSDLIAKLNEIDIKTVRPLRAKETGKATQEDLDKLEELEQQAETVRAKIREMGAQADDEGVGSSIGNRIFVVGFRLVYLFRGGALMELTAEIIGVVIVIIVQLISVGMFIGKNNEFKDHIIYRLDELEKKQDKHNNLIERMAVVERDVKSAHHRIDGLEQKNK